MKEITLFSGELVLVDDADYNELSKKKWSLAKGRRTNYAKCNERPFLIHLFILGIDKDTVVDHIDGDGLNNQRSNLRRISNAQNIQRQMKSRGDDSKYKGVTWTPHSKKKQWRAEIKVNGKRKHLGYYVTQEEAALAYNRAAIEAYGELAGLNPIAGFGK